MSMDDVNITRNKRLLDEIREEQEKNGRGYDQLGSRGYAEGGEGSYFQAEGDYQGSDGRVTGGTQGTGQVEGTVERYGVGVRPFEREIKYTAPGSYQSDRGSETDLEKEEREREANRQRQQRYRNRHKTERNEDSQNEAENVTLRYGVTDEGATDSPHTHNEKEPLRNGVYNGISSIKWKIPFLSGGKPQEKVKLFTNKESEDETNLQKLAVVYYQGTGLLDDLIEIVVRDHEEVQIWQLSEEEADIFATIHLQKAKVDEASARSARKLLEIHDRIYLYLYILPRTKATFKHVRKHGGFSFK